jgi:hypothetical protein
LPTRAGAATIKAMNRKHLKSALLLAAASLLATGAYAQSPNAAAAGKANAADKAEKAGDKPAGNALTADKDKKAESAAGKADKGLDKAADKAADKADKGLDTAADKAGDKGKSTEDRAARKAKEHEAQRDKLKSMLKGPMNAALKQELRRHAERLARLERIKTVAQAEKDTATVEKATTLIAKENERHDKWMGKHVATAAPATPPGTPPAAPAAVENKEGAK